MLEFAQSITRAIKETSPSPWWIITPRSSTTGGPACRWRSRDAIDYASGDFYGGAAQHSLVCKTFRGLTPHRPIEFATSRTRDLRDHATTKPFEEIRGSRVWRPCIRPPS